MNPTVKRLHAIGDVLYEPGRWQAPLARDLGISDRTVRHWVAGNTSPPVGLHAALLAIAERRKTRTDRAISLIHAGLSKGEIR